MNYFSIDYLIVYTFLAITLIIGIRAGKGIKDIKEYALANKTFGTGALVITYLATNTTGAGVLNSAGMVFSKGIIISIAGLGVIIAFLIRAFFIAPKAAHFTNCLTMGDLMKNFYGTYSGIITGILGFLTAICIAGMDLVGMGIVCETLLGIKANWVIVFGGLLLAGYSAYGGIKSVTATDIFQFIILFAIIPFLATIAIHKVGSIKDVFLSVPSEKLAVFTNENFTYYLTLFLIWSILPAGMVDPAIIQRLLMAKTGNQLRTQYLLIAAFYPVLKVSITLIGLAAIILYPSIEAINVIPHLIQNLLPIGLKGLAITAMLALSTSSIDSYLHAAGLTFSHDIIKPICDIKKIKINELRWAKYATILLSTVAILIALYTKNIFGLLLTSLAFTGPLLMFPLLSGIMGLKTDKQAFYIALIITLVSFGMCEFLLPPAKKYLSTMLSILVNGIVFFSIHIIKNKGLMILDKVQGKEGVWKSKQNRVLDRLRNSLPTPKNMIHYSQIKVTQYGAPYVLFGVFLGVNFIFPYLIIPHQGIAYNYNTIETIRLIGAVLCGLLVVREKWPTWLLPYLPTLWHLTVLYCLPFSSTMMFLLTQGSTEWLINIALNIMFLIVLVDWTSFIILTILGITLGLLFYRQLIGPINIDLTFTTGYLLIYQGIFATLIGLLFARRKQRRLDQLTTDNQTLILTNQETKEALLETFKEKVRLLQTLERAGIQELAHAVNLVKELRTQEQQGFKETEAVHTTIKHLQDTLTPMAVTLERIENRATDYLRLDVKPIALEVLLEEVQAKVHNLDLRFKTDSQQQEIICDPKRIEKMLLNSIHTFTSSETEEAQTIYISLNDTKLTYPLPSVSKDKNYVKQVAAIVFSITKEPSFPAIKASYEAQMNGSSLPMPETSQELLLVTNQRIVKAHYGYTNVNIQEKKELDTHVYVLPLQLAEVRPRDMDDPYMELGAELIRADDTYPGALEQEKALLEAVKKKSKANIESIKMALEMIKWYHGPKNRRSGEPFYLHPVAVAQIVLDYNQDEATILGALLHDTVEDTPMLLENIEMMFGPEVVRIVDGVTHFESTKDSFYKIKLSPQENILMLLETEEKRALYVKIADRMHNMRTIEGHRSDAKKRQIAEETLQFFVPLARELGLVEAANELKKISMKVLNS